METIVFAGGCFWCTEAVFLMLKGVKNVVSGYAGGKVPNPTYAVVSTMLSGHAEVNKIEFNSEEISLKTILDVFFEMHDPTSLDRQGADIGPQYRSAIFYTSEAQKAEIEAYVTSREKDFDKPIVTELNKLEKFYQAEEYHQNYYKNNPEQGYCRVVITPKLEKIRKKFGKQIKP